MKNRWTEKKKRDSYACCVCGFNRSVDFAHIVWKKDGGKIRKDNIAILCPNHHRLFDSGKLTEEEFALIKPIRNK